MKSKSFEKKDPKGYTLVPYVQGVSEAVATIMSDLDGEVDMKPMHTLSSILSHPKDRVPDADKSNVVHSIGCRDCNASFVGETGRAFKTHLIEHRKTFEKADFSSSALAKHAWSHHQQIDWTNAHILYTES